MQTPDLVTLRLFLAVVREGSMQRAAESEHIAASAISRRIGDLELTLGLKLLRRMPRGVELTAAGRVFAEYGGRILLQAKNLSAELERFREGIRGEVRFAAIPAALGGRLAAVLRDFCERFPEVELILQEAFSPIAVAAVRDGAVDLGVTADTVSFRDLEAEPFLEDPLWVVTPRGHPLLRDRPPGEPVAFAEACRYRLMVLHEGGPVYGLIINAIRDAGGEEPLPFSLTRVRSLRRLIELGFGIGFMRSSAVGPYLGSYDVEGAPLLDDWARQSLMIVHRGEEHMSPAARTLLGLLRRVGEERETDTPK